MHRYGAEPARWPAHSVQLGAELEKKGRSVQHSDEEGTSKRILLIRATFVYLRGAENVPELRGCEELTLHLPPRSSTLCINGKDVPCSTAASVALRRERSGSYVAMDSLQCSGVLPFELGRSAQGTERPEHWLMGTLHSTRCFPPADPAAGDVASSGWALELSSTALGTPCAVGRDVRVDVEMLCVGADCGGRPTCLSAHAPLPTRPGRSFAGLSRAGRCLESIAEHEKVCGTLPPKLAAHRSYLKALPCFWWLRSFAQMATATVAPNRDLILRQRVTHPHVHVAS